MIFKYYFTVDLISIDRRSRDREAECLERASVLANRFLESVQDTEDHVWKPSDRSPEQSERCVFFNRKLAEIAEGEATLVSFED